MLGSTALVAVVLAFAPAALARQAAPAATELAAPPVTSSPSPPQKRPRTKGDPLEGFNRSLFSAHQALDRALFRPAALGYKSVVPKPVRKGLRNFFSNLTEPIVFLNDLLQLKPGRAAKTLTRFFVNSTLGIGGLLDVAKGENLPHRANGLGNTLARYGVGPGPYLFLPLVGPTDLRDLFGGQVDGLVLPVGVGKPFDRVYYQVPHAVITGLDLRAESDAGFKALLDGAADPYATLRSVYQQNRLGEIAAIKGGTPPAAELDDPLADPEAPVAGDAQPEAAPPAVDTPADPAPDPAVAPEMPVGDDGGAVPAPPSFYTP